MTQIILASGSDIRKILLQNANVPFAIEIPRIDEQTVKDAMVSEGAMPRDIADTLAEMKARKISTKNPNALVIGSDQVLDFAGTILSKPKDIDDARTQLIQLRGKTHSLLSAAVIYENAEPVWRHVGQVRLKMKSVSDGYLSDYLSRNWDSIQTCVGGYKLEEEGVRLFDFIQGDYFNVLGLPLIELLSYLSLRGIIDS